MKTFVYSDLSVLKSVADALMPWFDGVGRLTNIDTANLFADRALELVEGPEQAELYLFPIKLGLLERVDWPRKYRRDSVARSHLAGLEAELGRQLSNFTYFSSRRGNHAFFQVGDFTDVLAPLRESVVFKTSVRKSSRALAMPYYVNAREFTEPTHPQWDVVFQGATGYGEVRKALSRGMKNLEAAGYRCRFKAVKWWHGQRTKSTYWDGLMGSRYVLCPRGIGLNSFRFFEAMSIGRIPILISDNAKLPLEESIDYPNLIVRVPEDEVLNIAEYISDFEKGKNLLRASDAVSEVFNQFFQVSVLGRLVPRSLLGF